MYGDILVDFGVQANRSVVATEVVVLGRSDKAGLVEVAETYIIRCLASLAVNRQVVSHRRCPLANHVIVWVEDTFRELLSFLVNIPVAAVNQWVVLANLAAVVLLPLLSGSKRFFVDIPECAVDCCANALHGVNAILKSIYAAHLHVLRDVLPCKVGWIRHVHRFGLGTLLGGDEDYTKCSLRTIDWSCGGILEHRDAFNVVGVNNLDWRNLHVVHQDEWLSRALERGELATNLDCWVRTDFAVRQHHVQARSSTLQTTTNVRNLTALKSLFNVHRRNSTGKVDFLLLAVTNHNEVFKFGIGAFESHIDSFWTCHFHSLGLHAHIGDLKHVACGGLNWISTINAGRHTSLSALYHNCSTNQRFTFGVFNDTTYSIALRMGNETLVPTAFAGIGRTHCYA